MLLPRVARPWRDRGALGRVSCAGALAAEATTHRAHPTHRVLTSPLKEPPDSRTLPRPIFLLASPKEQVRKTLKR